MPGSGIAQLGDAGVPHRDEDALNGISSMTSACEFDPCVHPGYFHIFDFGISFLMRRFVTIYFSGRHWHGGSPPVWPRDRPSHTTTRNVRATVINYPNKRTLEDKNALTAFASIDNGEVLKISSDTRMVQWVSVIALL
jgi:hypothetical protein